MTKVIEAKLDPEPGHSGNVKAEDGCAAIIATVDDGSSDEGLYVRLISWSEQGNHAEIKQFLGHKVRVTIETLD